MSTTETDDNGNKVLNGCLLALLFLSFLVVGSCLLIYKNRDSLLDSAAQGMQNAVQGIENLVDVPYYGREEYIRLKQGAFIEQIDALATTNSSLFSFAAAVEKMQKPDDLLFVGITHNDETVDVIKVSQWSNHSSIIMNGFGSGKVYIDGKEVVFMIYQNSGPWNYMEQFKVYFRHDVGQPVPDSNSLSY